MTSRNAGAARTGGEFPENKRNERDEEPGVTWDAKAEDYAVAHHTYENERMMRNETRYRMVVAGAQWQRDQLRTDDAVERVAEAMHENDCGCGDGTDDWYRGLARTAVNALLGEENGRADP